ncbi:hypothetical protein TNCV_958671 [Trichonephila clavipes]|nr:hypothetical protein TNCV_958671 [Trichonephila clavipes]
MGAVKEGVRQARQLKLSIPTISEIDERSPLTVQTTPEVSHVGRFSLSQPLLSGLIRRGPTPNDLALNMWFPVYCSFEVLLLSTPNERQIQKRDPDSLGLFLEETSVPSTSHHPYPSRRVMEIVGGRGIDELTVIPAVEGGRIFSWGAPTGLETTKGGGEGREEKVPAVTCVK